MVFAITSAHKQFFPAGLVHLLFWLWGALLSARLSFLVCLGIPWRLPFDLLYLLALWISVDTPPTSPESIRTPLDVYSIWFEAMNVDIEPFDKFCQVLKSWKSGPGSAVIFSCDLIDFSHRDSIGVSYGTGIWDERRSRGGSLTISHCIYVS